MIKLDKNFFNELKGTVDRSKFSIEENFLSIFKILDINLDLNVDESEIQRFFNSYFDANAY